MQINTISVLLYAHTQSITVLDLLVHYFINIYIVTFNVEIFITD